MLSRNSITITGSTQSITEIYEKISPATVVTDITNYHSYSSDVSKFTSIFFDSSYVNFGIEWAYFESCERIDNTLSIVAYSFNGNLFDWKIALMEKYNDSDDSDVSASMIIDKSVKFKNYEVEKFWTPTPISETETPIIQKKEILK